LESHCAWFRSWRATRGGESYGGEGRGATQLHGVMVRDSDIGSALHSGVIRKLHNGVGDEGWESCTLWELESYIV
jgi:hypothetical protein